MNENEYEATIKVLMPSNQKVTDYKIVVTAGNQVDAMGKVLKEWTERTSPDNFQSIDIKKIAKTEKTETSIASKIERVDY